MLLVSAVAGTCENRPSFVLSVSAVAGTCETRPLHEYSQIESLGALIRTFGAD